MIRRLKLKFISITMTIVTVMLILILGLQYRSAQQTLEAVSLQALQRSAENGANPFRPGIQGQHTGAPCFTLTLTHRGELLIAGDPYYDLTDTQQMLSLFQQASGQNRTAGVLKDASLRFYRTETPFGISCAFTDISGEQQAMAALLRSCILLGLGAFGAFLLLSILLARWAVRPVERAWQQQRQFVADASHELKTPLTVILTNAELLQDGRYDAAEKHRLAENIHSMSRQMRGLVESLLQLARADNGETREEKQLLDYSLLVRNSLLPFEPLYYEQGLTLESSLEPGIALTGCRQQLVQLTDILLDNGCKYSAPGSPVTVRLQRKDRKKCLLSIHSPGTPLSSEACRDIFKRFYRADEARAMSSSYGLGLAIAREIVNAHQGRIWAEPAPDGNVFYVSLPICDG